MNATKSIDILNKGVADELQAVLQYMYWHFHLDDQGYGPFASLFKRIAITEMAHIETLSERILFLKGDVEMTPAAPVEKITDPQKILARAAEMEKQSAADYNKYALACSANEDATSKQLFEELIANEEEHYDIFDTQVDKIKQFGPSYLALQSFQNLAGESKGGGGAHGS